MQEAVSEILIDRARETDSMSRMLVVSVAAHGVLLAVLLLTPSGWLGPAAQPEARALMISLGGVEGPDTGGMTPLSGRTAQALREPGAKPLPEPPPAPDLSAMALPTLAKPTPPAPPKPIAKPAERSATRKPTTGPEVRTGSSKVDTGAPPVRFGGLSTQSGGGSGGARTDYADFCCPEYLRTMTDLIRRNWQRQQGAAGTTDMKFVIERDGTITGIEVQKSSGQALLDQAARRALTLTMLPALPREFTGRQLTVYLAFDYER